LTHDHHHALAWARRLRLAAGAPDEDRLETARGFLEFFAAETILHFREEEELLFPLLVEHTGSVPEMVRQILTEHVELHALVCRLRRQAEAGAVPEQSVRDLGERLEGHIRLEERRVFPHIEQVVPAAALAGLHLAKRTRSGSRT
jgi:hemerythrin-like domain-containing protein